MKLTSGERANLFGLARQLTGMLGDPFQNPVDLTPADIEAEIALAHQTKLTEAQRYDRYISELALLQAQISAEL